MKPENPTVINRRISNTHAIILAGGSGSRLKSLTQWHSKPAVPFGGKYRTIDFPLSNCINSNIRKISVLTQYKSHSLNAHMNQGWSFLRPELDEYIELIPAQQRIKSSWYQGTADAVFQNMDIFNSRNPDYILILAGDHVYKMDYSQMIRHHINTEADVTIGAIEVPLEEAKDFGVMSVDANNMVTAFTEKPAKPSPSPTNPKVSLASMGIYVFNAKFLYQALLEDSKNPKSSNDFGKDIIPSLIGKKKVSTVRFTDPVTGEDGYWRDVGTVDAYYEANIELCGVTPQLNMYDNRWPIMTYQHQLPPAKFVFNDKDRRGMAVDSLVSAGCIVSGGKLKRAVLFNNVRVNSYSSIKSSVILPNATIGRNCHIKNAIIDRDCEIPENTRIGYDREQDAKRFFISEKGIVLVSAEMLNKELDKELDKELNDVA